MKPIIFLHPHLLKPSGASKVVLELSSRLAKLGQDTIIVTTKINPTVIDGYQDVKFVSLDFPTTGNIFFWLFFPLFLLKLKATIDKFPDSPLFCHSLAIYWGSAIKHCNRSRKVIYYIHDLGLPYTDSEAEISGLPVVAKYMLLLSRPILKLLNKKVVLNADYIIANSDTSASFFEKLYKRKIDQIIRPGVDTAIFKPSNKKESYLYTVGRLEKLKNIDLMIKSFALFHKRNNLFRFKIIGEGTELMNLILLAKKLGVDSSVDFVGRLGTKDVAALASRAMAGIFLCVNESFGIGAVESLSCGTPVVGVDQGGISEIISNSKIGFKSPLKPEMIAQILNLLVKDQHLLSEMSIDARNYSINNFSWNLSANKLSHYFKTIL